jgi:hypothetical protein
VEDRILKNDEATLEVGMLLLGIGIAVAMIVLVAGRALSFGQGQQRRAEPHPSRGTIKPERHQHVSTVAAR